MTMKWREPKVYGIIPDYEPAVIDPANLIYQVEDRQLRLPPYEQNEKGRTMKHTTIKITDSKIDYKGRLLLTFATAPREYLTMRCEVMEYKPPMRDIAYLSGKPHKAQTRPGGLFLQTVGVPTVSNRRPKTKKAAPR